MPRRSVPFFMDIHTIVVNINPFQLYRIECQFKPNFYLFRYSILLKSFTWIVEFSYVLLSVIRIFNFRLCNHLNAYHIFANYRINFEAACFKLNTIKYLLFILIRKGTIRERTETIVQGETEDRVAVLKQIKNGDEPWLKRKVPHLKFNRQPRPPGVSPIEQW